MRTCALAALLLCVGCSRVAPRPNIVLVVLDTVRRDFTGVEGPGGSPESLTPEFDELAAEGVLFPNAWANAPWTVPSHASMFTGFLPSVHGSFGDALKLGTEIPVLADLLADSGYETVTFFSNPWLTDGMSGMMRGFEAQYISGNPDMMDVLSTGDQGGVQTCGDISDWFEGRARGRPFFMFVNFLEAHAPYDPPDDYRETYLADLAPDDFVSSSWHFRYHAGLCSPELVDWERVRRLYAGDVNTSDRLLGNLVRLMRKHDLYDDAIIIVTSDHGENLGEHGLVGHWYCIYETLLAVPLVIRAPGRLAAGVRHDPIMLTDLFATVLDFAGIEDVSLPPHSRSIAGGRAPATRPLIAEYGGGLKGVLEHLKRLNPDLDTAPLETAYSTVRVDNLRLTLGSDGSESLHYMTTDPGQEHDLASENTAAAQALYEILREVHTNPGEPIEIDKDTEAWLRSLGYL